MIQPPGTPPPRSKDMIWHTMSTQDVLSHWDSSETGLLETDAAQRLATEGPNELHEGKRIGPLQILLGQFKSLIIWVLIIAGGISGVLGELSDAIAIFAIVILNAFIGFYQEFSAEKSIAALKRMTAPNAKVWRDGQITSVPVSKIIPGDLLVLEAGDVVAADARLLETAALSCIESPLTGESEVVTKQAMTLTRADLPLGDRKNMIFMGTNVAAGTGLAVVVATAMKTELGRIAELLEDAEEDKGTPLQQKLDAFGRILVWAALIIVGLLFGLGLLRGTPLMELAMTAISLAVAAVPEGLPAVVTIALSLGVLRMARRGALMRKLAAVETLGSTSVICTDKTGTLTVGAMTVRALHVAGLNYTVSGEGYGPDGEIQFAGHKAQETHLKPLLELGTILLGCNNAHLVENNGSWTTIGDPTEGALLVAGAKAGGNRERIDADMPKEKEFPFDSDRKLSSALRRMPDGTLRAFVNGAPGALLLRCTHLYTGTGIQLLTEQNRETLLTQTRTMATAALRVLGSAYRELGNASLPALTMDGVEHDLVFVGLTGMHDPPRPEAKEAVAKCHAAGIRVVMITGDHPQTAQAIAQGLGIASDQDVVVAGTELNMMSDEELRARVQKISVYARVTAEHKLRIIRALKANQDVVAMTGDGVNDAPAIKGADIGIAMGRSGTEVTKQAADMIITDDNFSTILAAVEEGRGIYDNIRKTLQYLLAGSTGELLLMTICVIIGLPSPLLPIHLLWINLVTDGLPALCLSIDPIDPEVMRRFPRRLSESITNRGFLRTMSLTGLLTAGVAFGVYYYGLRTGSTETARTQAFTVLVFAELLRSFGARSETKPVWRISLLTNVKLVAVVAISFALQLWSQHSMTFGRFLKTSPMPYTDCALLLLLGAIPLMTLEIIKLLRQAASPARWTSKLEQKIRRGWSVTDLAAHKFLKINGAQWAGAFAFNTFFSLFPLTILLVSILSVFIDREIAGKAVIDFMESYTPVSAKMKSYIFGAISGVIKTREQASIVAFLALVWTTMQCFTTLILATNRAWGNAAYNWWMLPLKSLAMLSATAGVVLLGMAAPALAKMTQGLLFPMQYFQSYLYDLGSFIIPILVMFFGLCLFYRFAPIRPTKFAEVWLSALCATALLRMSESLFIIYLQDFTPLNTIYGVFGGIMSLLLWIYVSGGIYTFGACLCASLAEVREGSIIQAQVKHP